MPQHRFDVGILGAGSIAAECHIPALLASQDARVAWVADRDLSRAQTIAKSFGLKGVAATDSIEALPSADVLLLAIPYGVREPLYETIARKFGAVYVEKPFALTLAQHDRQSASFAPERIAVGYQRRSAGGVRALRDIVRSKLFGDLKRIRMGFGGPGVKTGGRYSSSLALAGGGVLFEVGVHGLDMAFHVTDAVATEPVSVSMTKTDDGFDLHTKATLQIVRSNEASIPFDLIVTSLEYAANTHVFTFEQAELTFSLFGEQLIEVRSRDGSCNFVLNNGVTEYPRSSSQVFHEHWHCFFDAIRQGKVNGTSAIASRVTTQAVEQLYAQGEGA